MSENGPKPDGAPKPDEKSTKEDGGRLNALQITAATCASTTAAVVATALGVYGTVIGVAVFSIVSSVGTVLFVRSMNRTKKTIDKVVKTRGITTKTPRTPPPAPATNGGTTKIIGTAAVPKPGEAKPDPKPTLKEFSKRNWRMLAITSVVVFALSVAVLTGIALLSGKPATAFYDTDSRPPVTSDEQEPSQDEPGQAGGGESESPQRPSQEGTDSPSPEESDTPEQSPDAEDPTTEEPPEDGESTEEQRELPPTSPQDEG
ncbi:MAG: hypothetical protein ACRD0P_01455 [Stackebrandtia sp.]